MFYNIDLGPVFIALLAMLVIAVLIIIDLIVIFIFLCVKGNRHLVWPYLAWALNIFLYYLLYQYLDWDFTEAGSAGFPYPFLFAIPILLFTIPWLVKALKKAAYVIVCASCLAALVFLGITHLSVAPYALLHQGYLPVDEWLEHRVQTRWEWSFALKEAYRHHGASGYGTAFTDCLEAMQEKNPRTKPLQKAMLQQIAARLNGDSQEVYVLRTEDELLAFAAGNEEFMLRWLGLARNNPRQTEFLGRFLEAVIQAFVNEINLSFYDMSLSEKVSRVMLQTIDPKKSDNRALFEVLTDYREKVKLLAAIAAQKNQAALVAKRVFSDRLAGRKVERARWEEAIKIWSLFNAAQAHFALDLREICRHYFSEQELELTRLLLEGELLEDWTRMAATDRRLLYNLKLFIEAIDEIVSIHDDSLPAGFKELAIRKIRMLRSQLVARGLTQAQLPHSSIEYAESAFTTTNVPELSLTKAIDELLETLAKIK